MSLAYSPFNHIICGPIWKFIRVEALESMKYDINRVARSKQVCVEWMEATVLFCKDCLEGERRSI